ncbi:hypothetical protein ACTU45_15580 [Streptomyces sp. 24-1644]|uniref:hypothetical protein n=1 Tax=Streptomyces sp. 24-1644 TaxID=3457315 RepID=UPI003FA722B9
MNDDRDITADVAALAAMPGGYYYAPDLTAGEQETDLADEGLREAAPERSGAPSADA